MRFRSPLQRGHWGKRVGSVRDLLSGLAGLALVCLSVPAAAQTIADPTAPPTPAARVSGPPSPFTFTGAYTADLLDDVAGGARAGDEYIDLLKLSAAYDGGVAGRQGLTGLISIEHSNGANFTGAHVGGFQAVSSNEAQPGALRLYEVWVQQTVAGGAGGVKAGLIDINTTFDVQETAALFINASHGIGPDFGDSGFNGPSDYPTTALAVAGVYRAGEGWTAQIGVFDGVAGNPGHRGRIVDIEISARYGALIVGQVERRFGDVARIEGGVWAYTAKFPSLDQFTAARVPRRVGGNDGVYALAEGRLLGRSGGGNQGGLSGWLRVGFANGDINRAEDYQGGGLVYTGLIHGRDKDEIGIAIARAGFGSGAREAGARAGQDIGDAETDLEATYRYAFRDWLNIQPDVQYVFHPSGDLRRPNALVVGMRLAFSASK